MAKKWEGKAKEELKGCKAEQVWLLLQDFFGLDKWFPTLSTCIPVEGVSGQSGCVRYCAGFKTHVDQELNWTKQKLLAIDSEKMVLSYAIVDGNVGFHGYVSTVSVLDKENDGCEIEWKYEVEPVGGWRVEDLDLFIGSGLHVMATRMVDALRSLNSLPF